MVLSLQTLIRKTRQHVGHHESYDRTVEDYVNDYISSAQEEIASSILIKRDKFLSTYFDITLDGSREYDLPRGVDRIFAFEDISSGANNPIDTTPVHFENRFIYLQNFFTRLRYYLKDGKIGIPSELVSGTFRVWYPNYVKPLFYGTVTATTSNTVTFTTATTGSIVPVDDYYNGMYLVNTNGEFKEVTDFVGSTLVFTVDSDWAVTPTIVSLASPIPPRFQTLLHLTAGINWRLDLDMPIGDMIHVRDREMEQLNLILGKRQTHKSHHVKKTRR